MASRRSRTASTRNKVAAHRARLRAQGLRPLQIWVPDVRSASFAAEARRQSRRVARAAQAASDQDFVESVTDWGSHA
jgi:Protein  of unknown function (DUF3018)